MIGNPIYRAERLPIFQNRIFRTYEAATNCTTGDIALTQDPQTGLIANQAFRPELMNYDADYHNEQGLSAVFRWHLQDVSQIISTHFGRSTLIEVGCGKGHFLEELQSQGFLITGMDPTYEGSNPAILKQYFNSKSGLSADGIILRHVLEHVQNPVHFLSEIRDANGGSGRIYIEVPCVDWIRDHRAWFDIFYEHVNYFRLPDFSAIFGTVYEAGRIFGGQYLYAVADLGSLRIPANAAAPFDLPCDFMGSVARFSTSLKNSGGTPSAIWGAASKGVIFALFMERAGCAIDMVVDINPAKQGSFLPVTGLKVCSPETAIRDLPRESTVIVMNGNYLQEVKRLTKNRFQYTTVDHENI